MITYLIKSIMLSGFFYLLFCVLLINNVNHHFKRFYLLFAVIVSVFIPFLHIPIVAKEFVIPPMHVILQPLQVQNDNVMYNTYQVEGANFWQLLAFISYGIVSLFLFKNFTLQVRKIILAKRNAKKVKTDSGIIFLQIGKVNPHSFFQYIFVSEDDYYEEKISPEIIQHEQLHARQLHSLDIILLELISCFFWINPFFYLYKQAVRLNHEYLADRKVVASTELHKYMQQILNYTKGENSLSLVSDIHFTNTKKRFIMMAKKTNPLQMFLTTTFSILLMATGLYFSSATAQVPPASKNHQDVIMASGTGANPAELKEYDEMLTGMTITKVLKNGKTSHGIDMAKGNLDRLAEIFYKMDETQRNERVKQTGVSIVPRQAPQKISPSQAQLNQWRDDKAYGVWLDGKRIENEKLASYKSQDFGLYFESKLSKNAVNYGKHYYQIDLYTNQEYDNINWQKNMVKFSAK